MKRGFTLIELIVVIIVVGILAAIGLDQYEKAFERGRTVEAKTNLGVLRQLAVAYRLENGTIDGITNADLNIGTAADQIPSACRNTHYFYYTTAGEVADPVINLYAMRCTSGGKSPNHAYYQVRVICNLSTGVDQWVKYFGYWPGG
ncbi:MAG: prepilin-type N-terminal cleavage/methylation domain-containing protein [Candidatus Omnitrophica bacterium]|nr:prepilin-type N-terminal cleavage/methylation domain-containing protein [Candidatus Omnitrophota bacterium]